MNTRSPARAAGVALTALALATILSGCGGDDRAQAPQPRPQPTTESPNTRRPPESASPGKEPIDGRADHTEETMQIHVTIADQRFTGTLDDSAAAVDLLAQLPVTVHMTDHGGLEKTGPLPSPLSLAGQPEGADPDVGDLGYYAPGNDLVLYYGDQSYYPGIVVLGRLDSDAATRTGQLRGPVRATVEAG